MGMFLGRFELIMTLDSYVQFHRYNCATLDAALETSDKVPPSAQGTKTDCCHNDAKLLTVTHCFA